MKTNTELKGYQTQVNKIEGEISVLKTQQGDITRNINLKLESLKKLKEKIYSLIKKKDKEYVITEHAYLRYFERVLGFDLQEVGKIILNNEILHWESTLGDGTYPHQEGEFKVVIKDKTVVTIL